MLHQVISYTLEEDNNVNNSETFSVSNLSDSRANSKSFPGSFLRKSKSFYIPNKLIFGWGVLLLSIPDIRVDTLG